jgi:putative metalloenzyme radical SAM/SPASM domain maturase
MNSPSFPRKLYAEITTLCNLNCAMCVKQSPGWNCEDGLMDRRTFESLSSVFPYLDTLILNGIGESLLHPELSSFISFARNRVPDSCIIGFQSNGMLLTASLAAELVDAGLDRISFSVDSPDAEQLKQFRAGAELGTVAQSFAIMREAANRPGARPLSLGAETVLNIHNYQALPEMVYWCADQGAEFVIVSNALPYSASDVGQSLYVHASQTCLDFFAKWKKIFQAERMDILLSYKAYYTVFRTPEQKRQVQLMLAMLEDARKRNLQFSLPDVMQVDVERLERVRETFARSVEVAQQAGIRLDLPALAAREPRQCPFVQDPSLFVAYDGTITPCYYLWHSYSNWQGNAEIRVQQKAFGRTPKDDPIRVWNSEEFSRFRSEAVREEYARCGDCGVAPCDYVQGLLEPFAKDCYGAVVPCGICPWSGGGFACLQ